MKVCPAMIDERWDGRCVISAKFDPLAFVISPLAFFCPKFGSMIWVSGGGIFPARGVSVSQRILLSHAAASAAANFGCKTIRLLRSLPGAH